MIFGAHVIAGQLVSQGWVELADLFEDVLRRIVRDVDVLAVVIASLAAKLLCLDRGAYVARFQRDLSQTLQLRQMAFQSHRSAS